MAPKFLARHNLAEANEDWVDLKRKDEHPKPDGKHTAPPDELI